LPYVSRVYRDHLRKHITSYFYGANLHPVVSILSGRGCPHKCAYCVYPQTMMGNRYRMRSVSNVVDELEFIQRELPEVREIFIEDDTLTANRKRARLLSQEIIDRKMKITWSTNSRADADLETLKIMNKAGCRLLCVGFESGSQDILDKLGKHISCDRYMKFRKDAAEAGILIHGCFMYGNDGESMKSMRKTLEMAKQLNCDTAQFYPIMVYPGTRAYDNYKIRGWITAKNFRDWLTPEGLHNCVVSLPNLPKETLVNFCDQSRREFYLRPKYILSKVVQILRKPWEAKRIIRASRTLLKYIFRPSLR
jgi:anaerobic magnesium-protoporphyrin IX monomethyl ester cyclase